MDDYRLNEMIKLCKRICNLYKNLCWSKERQARSVGVSLGENNFIDSKFWSSEPYLITVGNNCQITSGVKFLTHGGGQVLRNNYPDFDSFGKVIIGDYVYIGANVLVMPGVTIGNNVLVAAGSIVTKSIPSNVVIAGNPARIVSTIDDYYERNSRYNVKSKSLSFLEKKKLLLSISDELFIKKDFI